MPFSTLFALEPTTTLSRFAASIVASIKPLLALRKNVLRKNILLCVLHNI